MGIAKIILQDLSGIAGRTLNGVKFNAEGVAELPVHLVRKAKHIVKFHNVEPVVEEGEDIVEEGDATTNDVADLANQVGASDEVEE